MWVVSEVEDKYISSTWGAAIRLYKGVPKELGQDLALLCLQSGCVEVKRAKDDNGHFVADNPETPEVNEAYDGGVAPPKKKAPAKKKVVAKKTT
tara:strand:+ start:422 stop:703 length:282 start_codon:yes stop_codon:yes gene_type:complete